MKNDTVYLGIDPGKTGAIAVVGDNVCEVYDYPGDEVGAAALVLEILAEHAIQNCALELVHSFSGQGVSSTFSFGKNFGIWLGILATAGVSYRLVRPQEWQKGLISKADGKEATLATARRLFPTAPLERKKDHGRADALLIADWCRRVSRNNS